MKALLSNVSVCGSLSWQVSSNTRRTKDVYSNLRFSSAQLALNGKVLFLRASIVDNFLKDEPFSSIVVSEDLWTEEKEEAKNILASFLEKQGLSSDISVDTVENSNLVLDHLVSKLHSVRLSRQLAGQELRTVEIGEILLPYLESLSEQYGVPNLADNFIDPTVKEVSSVSPISPSNTAIARRKLRAISMVDKRDLDGNLSPRFLYLLELGFDLEQIKKMVWKYPSLTYCTLEGKIKPLIEFLLALGVSKSDIPSILRKWPRLCGYSVKNILLPNVALLESLGVNKRRWPIVLRRGACILSLSRQNIVATVDFLLEVGVRSKNIGKIIERCPTLVGCSVENKLRPIVEYFRSFGVDVAKLLHQCPSIFMLSIEGKLKHVTRFFMENGFSEEELVLMTKRFGCIYCYSLANNLVPKWEYFLTMDYPKEDLVECPNFFGFSLEKRIKPRYALVKEYGVEMSLSLMLILSDLKFDRALNKKVDKLLSSKGSRVPKEK